MFLAEAWAALFLAGCFLFLAEAWVAIFLGGIGAGCFVLELAEELFLKREAPAPVLRLVPEAFVTTGRTDFVTEEVFFFLDPTLSVYKKREVGRWQGMRGSVRAGFTSWRQQRDIMMNIKRT